MNKQIALSKLGGLYKYVGPSNYGFETNKEYLVLDIVDKYIRVKDAKFDKEFFNENFKAINMKDINSIRCIKDQDYYTLPNGVTCIQVIRYFPTDIGNAIKYLWRHGRKEEEGIDTIDKAIEDLRKSIIYIEDQIKLLEESKNE